jgi:hypothetical protein
VHRHALTDESDTGIAVAPTSAGARTPAPGDGRQGLPDAPDPQQIARLADRADDRPRRWTAFDQCTRHHAERAHPEHARSCATAATAQGTHRRAGGAVVDGRRQHEDRPAPHRSAAPMLTAHGPGVSLPRPEDLAAHPRTAAGPAPGDQVYPWRPARNGRHALCPAGGTGAGQQGCARLKAFRSSAKPTPRWASRPRAHGDGGGERWRRSRRDPTGPVGRGTGTSTADSTLATLQREVDAPRWLDGVTAAVVTSDHVDPGAGKLTSACGWPSSTWSPSSGRWALVRDHLPRRLLPPAADRRGPHARRSGRPDDRRAGRSCGLCADWRVLAGGPEVAGRISGSCRTAGRSRSPCPSTAAGRPAGRPASCR